MNIAAVYASLSAITSRNASGHNTSLVGPTLQRFDLSVARRIFRIPSLSVYNIACFAEKHF